MDWKVVAAAVTGQSHLETGGGCQDAVAYHQVRDWLVAVVCDGAGSAPESAVGAQIISARLVAGLARALLAGPAPAPPLTSPIAQSLTSTAAPSRLDPPAFLALLQAEILEARAALLGAPIYPTAAPTSLAAVPPHPASGPDPTLRDPACTLRDHACTLVGCVVGAQGGYFFHIGDGYAAHYAGGGCTVQLSPPENGEYSDQTYFVTDHDWERHLRLVSLSAPEPAGCIVLMSDGSAPFAIQRSRDGLFAPFIDPVLRHLRAATPEQGHAALCQLLASPATCAITADDKTLLVAFPS